MKLVIPGLSSLDEEELQEIVGASGLEFSKPEVPEGTLAEPATITAIITLAPLVITGLAAWLCKGRRKRVLTGPMRIVHPDGRVEERSLRVEESSEEPCKSKVLAELRQWLGRPSDDSER